MTAPTNAMTYNLYVTQVATMAVVDTQTVASVVQGVDAAFNAIIPNMLDYAELRIQRDLDLLPSMTSRSYNLSNGVNLLQLSVDDFVTVQTMTVTSVGETYPLLPASKEFLQNVYGSATSKALPQYFAMYGGDLTTSGSTYNNIIVGPYPDAAYAVNVVGTIRLPSLYQFATTADAPTKTTFISTYLPDLLMQASMIYISEFQRNFSPVSNDPQMPGIYETQYQTLLRGAGVEEARKKFSASGWTSMSLPVAATPGR